MSEAASNNSHGSVVRGETGALLTALQIIRKNQHVITTSSRQPKFLTNDEEFIDMSDNADFLQNHEANENSMICPDNIADMLIIVREQRQARISAAETLYHNSRQNGMKFTQIIPQISMKKIMLLQDQGMIHIIT